jgi:hypothetical protein
MLTRLALGLAVGLASGGVIEEWDQLVIDHVEANHIYSNVRRPHVRAHGMKRL